MKLYTTTCPDCGWTSKPTKTQGLAAYGLRLHSCEKYRALLERARKTEAARAAIDRTPKPCQHNQADHQHGTYVCYVRDACRCRPCADANTAYERQRVRQQAYGRWAGLVDAEPVRAHVRALLAAGMGHKQIIQLAGGSGGVWTKLMYGHDDRPPARRVTQRTANAYLSISLPRSLADLPARHIIPGHGTRRRLQALARLGWSVQRLADGSGIDRQRLDGALRGRDVQARTALAVQRLYDALWDTPPTALTPRQQATIDRTIRRAQAAGWAPPLAWDEDRIDDPDATPTIGHQERGIDMDDVIHLARYGYTPETIAQRLGVTWPSLLTAIRRAGRDDIAAKLLSLRDAA